MRSRHEHLSVLNQVAVGIVNRRAGSGSVEVAQVARCGTRETGRPRRSACRCRASRAAAWCIGTAPPDSVGTIGARSFIVEEEKRLLVAPGRDLRDWNVAADVAAKLIELQIGSGPNPGGC